MGLILFGIMIVLPITEIAVFIVVGKSIGLWPTLIGIALTALIGSAIIRHQGVGIVASARRNLAAGEAPVGEVLEGLALLIAGMLLVTPGFVTDTLGFLLLVPTLRRAMAQAVVGRVARRGGTHVLRTADTRGDFEGDAFAGESAHPRGQPHGGPGWPGAGPRANSGASGAGAGVVIDGEWRDLDDRVPPDGDDMSKESRDRHGTRTDDRP